MTDARAAHPLLVLVLVCLAQFMVVLDATVTNVALPSIQADLSMSEADLQWVVNAYTLVFGGFLLLGGRAADLLGRKRLFVAGVVLFTLASLLDGLATSSGMLIGARALQGLGAAFVSPAALSIITTTFDEGPERTKALGVWAAIAAGGGAVGLLLGGLLTDLLSWPWVFLVNVPVGVAAVALSLRFVPESRAELAHRRFDALGAVSITAGLVALVYGIVRTQEAGWTSASTLAWGAVALALLALFVVVERRSPAPLVRLDIFRVKTLRAANVVLLLVASGLFAMFFFNSLYVQRVLGYSPLEAGLAFLPFTAGIVAGAGISQRLVPLLGVREVAAAGMAVATVGTLLLLRLEPGGSYAVDLLPALLPIAVGMGLAFVPITLIATGGLPDRDAGLASGIFNTSQQVGGALGLAVLSTLAVDRTSDRLGALGAQPTPAQHADALVAGFHVAYAGSAVFLAAGALLLLALLRRREAEEVATGEAATVPA